MCLGSGFAVDVANGGMEADCALEFALGPAADVEVLTPLGCG